jgi:hypothetical protein
MGLSLGNPIIIVLKVSGFETVKAFSLECINGDIHLILKDLEFRVCAMYGENIDEADAIKKIRKEEAFKPLFLMRN